MKRYAIVGAGFRCYTMFVENILNNKDLDAKLVAVYDTNKIRSQFFKEKIGDDFNIYDDFDKMLDTEKPDGVIIATPDTFHHKYIIRALEKGYDAITEKPITNSYKKCLEINKALKKSGKKVTVTFNCRFMPFFINLKKLICENKIGKILNITYDYRLDYQHGGDYFKRWHRFMENSGGMLVHKSTHHFDIINWILQDEPEYVSAFGNRLFYGDTKKSFAERCKDCPKQSECLSFESQTKELDNQIYYNAEKEDGYLRDKCCYADDSDIYDNMSVSVKYKKGTLLTYSLNLFSPIEGFRLAITGENGMIVYDSNEIYPDTPKDKISFKIIYNNGKSEIVYYDKASGRHNGGDPLLIKMVFGKGEEDPYGQHASCYEGFMSALIGISANESIKTGKTINIQKRLAKLR